MKEGKKITGFAVRNAEGRKDIATRGGLAFKLKLDNDPILKKANDDHLLDQSNKNWKNTNTRSKMIKNLDWSGKKHSDETKSKISKSMKGAGIGSTNSQYGSCWITRGGENKKIKKEDLDTFEKQGWEKGRKTASK